MEDDTSARDHRKRSELGRILVKEEVKIRAKLVSDILRKDKDDRTIEDEMLLDQCPELVEDVTKKMKKRLLQKEREKEVEDAPDVVYEKSVQLAQMLQKSKFAVVYTGAGISTAASIPDYRGPKGVWTMLQKGKEIGPCDVSEAEPTLTHMCIAELYRKSVINYVVSQNCDGLHLRSGLPRLALSEVHGNMYIEVCKKCRPHHEYIRQFDVTERTSLRRHATGRKCYKCNQGLVDTIVHFGEKGTLKSPLNWSKAIKAANKCDLILCLGSSLKVLKKYSCLWGMDRPLHSRPKLCIVNLQWTPKDSIAALKINGHCDDVLKIVMDNLSFKIPFYKREKDPLFRLAVQIKPDELNTTTRKPLEILSQSVDKVNEVPATDVKPKVKRKLSADTESGEEDAGNITDEPQREEVEVKDETDKNYEDNSIINEKEEPKNNADSDTSKAGPCVNSSKPGWFGKGYRKIIKKKRRRKME